MPNDSIASALATIRGLAKEDAELRALFAERRLSRGRLAAADDRHTRELAAVVEAVGWEAIFGEGEAVAREAWLLVQHSDGDPAFQEATIAAWRKLGDLVEGWQVAYLEDRVRMNRGRPQLYGTQFRRTSDGSGWEPWPIEAGSVEELDDRRLAAGLEPFANYYRQMTGVETKVDVAMTSRCTSTLPTSFSSPSCRMLIETSSSASSDRSSR